MSTSILKDQGGRITGASWDVGGDGALELDRRLVELGVNKLNIFRRAIMNRTAKFLTYAMLPALMYIILFSGCAYRHATDPYAPVSWYGTAPSYQTSTYKAAERQPVSLDGPLTLEKALETALNNNPEIAATQWDIYAAESKVESEKADLLPTISFEGGCQHYFDDQRLIAARSNGEPGVFNKDITRGDLILRLPLFTGGRLNNEISAAKLLKDAEENRLARTREELIYNVSAIFYTILGQREVIRSLQFSINAMEEHTKRISDLLAAQKAAKVDLLRAEVRLADLRQNLLKEENNLAIEKRLLINMLGVDYDQELLQLQGALALAEIPSTSSEDLIAEALKSRSDYLAARSRLEAQAMRVDAAIAGRLPTIFLQGNYGLRVAGLADEAEDAGSIGVGISVPLFEGGKTRAQVNQEKAGLAASQERLRKLELQIRSDVETAALDIKSISERVEVTQKFIEQAKESLRIERMKYELGSGAIIDVLDAQSALLQSETNYAKALADLRISIARLLLAKGGEAL